MAAAGAESWAAANAVLGIAGPAATSLPATGGGPPKSMVERGSADGLAGAAGCVGATFAAKRTVAPGAAAGLATGAIVPARDSAGFCGGIAVGEGNSIVCGEVPATPAGLGTAFGAAAGGEEAVVDGLGGGARCDADAIVAAAADDCAVALAGTGPAGLAEAAAAGADSRFARKMLPHFPHRTGRPCGPIRASSIRYRAWHLSQRTSIVGPSGTDRNVR